MNIKNLLVLSFCFFLSGSLIGQKPLNPCGTPPGKSLWLKKYQENPANFDTRSGDPLYFPLTVFSVGDDTGLGAFSETSTLDALCRLQMDFEGTDIYFYLHSPIKFLYNTAYFDHETVVQGANMMFDNNVPNTLNNYIVRNPAGNCGYNLPYAGVALGKACANPADHTWAHEVGHALSIQHPFLGWEGGVSYDGSEFHDYNEAAPETVLYDYTLFKDTLILDTLIIDTAYVEKMDGSNCHFAADGFCDTAPDYLAQRWPCDGDGNSLIEQTDPDGVKFYSQGANFMTYAFDNCANSFTPEQIAAMRANILTEKADYIDPSLEILAPVDGITSLQYPINDEMVPYSGTELGWEEVDNATAYLVQLGFEPSVTAVLFDTIVYANQATFYDLNQNYKYYWRVKAFNDFDFCNEFSGIEAFETGDFVSTNDKSLDQLIHLAPNPVSGEVVAIIYSGNDSIESVVMYNTHGQKVKTTLNQQRLELGENDGGLYYIQIQLSSGSTITKKLLVFN